MMTLTAKEIRDRKYRGVSAEQRFWAKVDKRASDECWNWTGCLGVTGGYGFITISPDHWGAHRLSWVLHFGDFPNGLLVLHKCDNRRCVNPGHLFLGTHADNLHDAMDKGRWVALKGSKVGTSKLTEKDAREIREMFDREEITHKSIAERFGVTEPNIKNIIDGKSWKHAGGPIGIKKNNRRWIWGERHRSAKLSERDVVNIRAMARSGVEGFHIADKYPAVRRSAIYGIINGNYWKHVVG